VSLLARNKPSFRHPKLRPNFTHMSIGIGTAAVMLLIYFSLNHTFNVGTSVSILIFNFLFVFLLFPLEGSPFRKVYLLIAGNIVGFLWHLIKSSLRATSALFLGAETFKIIIVVFEPIIDLVWVVSLWSLSLSTLASGKKRNEGDEKKN